MRLAERNADRLQFAAGTAKLVRACCLRKLIADVFGQKFGCGVDPFELAQLIEIAIVQWGEGGLQRLVGAADIDDDTVRIKSVGKEGCIDNEGCPMEGLCRSEHGPTERVGNHDVIADFDGKQRSPLVVGNELSDDIALRIKQCGQPRRQIAKPYCRSKQRVEARIGKQIERGAEPLAMCPAWPM